MTPEQISDLQRLLAKRDAAFEAVNAGTDPGFDDDDLHGLMSLAMLAAPLLLEQQAAVDVLEREAERVRADNIEAIALARQEEREACCAILHNTDPQTRMEDILGQLGSDDVMPRLPADLRRLLGDLCEVAADDRKDLEQRIRARGGEPEEADHGIGDFGTDPADSAALLELRQIIDDEIGWPSEAAEREADYPARLRQLGAVEKAARADHDACIANLHDEELCPETLALRNVLKASGVVKAP